MEGAAWWQFRSQRYGAFTCSFGELVRMERGEDALAALRIETTFAIVER